MNRLNTTLLIIFCLLLVAKSAFAEVLRWPQGCLTAELQVKNTTTSPVRSWLQKFEPTLISETEYVIPASSESKITIIADSSAESYSLLHFKNSGTLKASLICGIEMFPAHNLEGGILTFRRSDLTESKLWLQNLYSDENDVQIEILDRRMMVLETFNISLKSLSKMTYKIPESEKSWNYIRVQAANRFTVFNLKSTGSDSPFIIARQPSYVIQNAAYFEVKNQEGFGDSFIVKITNPAMIAKAREQIKNPTLEKILFAKIQKGHAGFNRNWSKKEKSFWSWSAAEVTNIADIGSTYCNGLPQSVEDRTDHWTKNPGRICFWTYRIKKELKPSEIASGEIVQ